MIDAARRLALLEGRYDEARDPWELAFVACARGAFEDALERGRPLCTVAEDDLRAQARLTVGSALRQLGRYDDAETIERTDDLTEPHAIAHLTISRAADAIGRGDADAASRTLATVGTEAGADPEMRRIRIRRSWVAAELCLLTGRARDALELLDVVRPDARGWPRHEAKTALFAGVAARTAGDDARCRDELHQAIELGGPLGAAPIVRVASALLDEHPSPYPAGPR